MTAGRTPVVVDPTMAPATVSLLRERRPGIRVDHPESVAAAVAVLQDADSPVLLLTRNSSWREDYLDGLGRGDWVMTKTTGYENLPVESFDERGIVFSNVPGMTVKPIGEHVFALAFTVTRNMHVYHDQQEECVWERRREGMTDLAGDVCCVVGIGRIGETVAERAAAFEMEVRGVKRSVAGYDGVADAVYPAEDLLAALDAADLVVVSVPLTNETVDLLAGEELAAVDDGAILVNVARGEVVNTPALVDALDAGELGAACLDVVDERPPPPDWPLWGRDDVVVTPHVAGASDKSPERLTEVVLAEYDRWERGEAPANRRGTAGP